MRCTTPRTNPVSHSETFQPFGAAEASALETGLRGPSFVSFDIHCLPSGSLVTQHVPERGPACVQNGFSHSGFSKLRRVHIADDDIGRVAIEELTFALRSIAHPAPADAGVVESQAAADVLAERKRQIESEGWTPEHDDMHHKGEMAQAAAVYAHPLEIELSEPLSEYHREKNAWPWYDLADVSGGRGYYPVWAYRPAWLKKTDRRRNLVKAGALIIAEIERLDRAALRTKGGE